MSSKKIMWLLPLCTLAACHNGGNASYDGAPYPASTETSAKADTSAMSAANAPINSPERKVIHTADFHCKVRNVFTATTKLEQLVKSLGGIVQESNLENSGYDTRTSYYTADSLRETRTYTTTSVVTLRVPSPHLDSVINAIPGMVSFIDSRLLKQSDVTYNYLSNVLKNQVGNDKSTTRAMQLAKKSNDPIYVQAYDDSKQEQRIAREIENMNLMDNVNYATLTVAFSQPEEVFVQTIVNPEYIARTPFLLQCKSALNTGWELVRTFVVWLIKIWPVLIVMIAGWLTWRRLMRRQLVLVKK